MLDEYAEWMRSWGASENTIGSRLRLARSRLKAWGDQPFDTRLVERFLAADERGERRKPWTRATYFNHLTSFCEWMVATGRWDANPMDGMKKPKRGPNVPRPLSEAEVARVLQVATGDVRAWLVLALTAGLRAHEIAKISGGDVTPDGIYVEGKGETVDVLPCSVEIAELATHYPKAGYWFPGAKPGTHIPREKVTNDTSQLFRSVGIPRGSIHRARHVYATRLLRNGVHIRTVQKLMRHASLATTANYTAVDEDELKAAIGQLPPLPPAA